MIKLNDLVSSVYEDRSSLEIIEILDRYNLKEPLRKTIIQLNSLIADEDGLLNSCKAIPVGHLASNLLWAVNERIRKEKDAEVQLEMENTMSDICLSLLKSFFICVRSDSNVMMKQIDVAHRGSCEFHNYDYNLLIRRLRIERAISYFQTLRNADKFINTTAPSYCWKGKPVQRKDLLEIFGDHKLVKSKKRHY